MLNKKIIALVATAALATCLGLAGCGGSQSASSSAASASAASSTAAASTQAASQQSAAASQQSASAAASNTAASTSAQATSASAAASSAAASASAYIGEQAAIDVALADAGFAASDVTELDAELDLDDAVVHYDVDFKQGGMDYDYDIDATTGAILTSHSEVDD